MSVFFSLFHLKLWMVLWRIEMYSYEWYPRIVTMYANETLLNLETKQNWIRKEKSRNKNCCMLAEEIMFRHRSISEKLVLHRDFRKLIIIIKKAVWRWWERLLTLPVILLFKLFFFSGKISKNLDILSQLSSWTELSFLVLEYRS